MPESTQLQIDDLKHRVLVLEQEKLGQGLALVQLAQEYQGRELKEIKESLARLEQALTNLRDAENAEQAQKQQRVRSWKSIWTYVVGGLVAAAAVASPIITAVLSS